MPLGTLIFDRQYPDPIYDVTEDGRNYVIARGGRGGRGNARFATPSHKAPTEFDPGEQGEERRLKLVLKLLADVGIVGMPNAGKSTLISCLTDAKPKIGDYPFTTLTPTLGAFRDESDSFVIADIPGIVEDASKGKGLGLTFLKHIERTRRIMLVLDLSSPSVVEDYRTLLNELGAYKEEMLKKERVVILNKIDLSSEENGAKCEDFFTGKGETVVRVSALKKKGIDHLKALLKGFDDKRKQANG